MDNMYVYSNSDSKVPTTGISFVFAGVYMEDADKNSGNNDYTLTNFNPNDKWPTVLHIFGTFGAIPATTSEILIFFDYLEPLTSDGVET